MALTAGTRLGPYEILAPIGAGGMGEVYRALDTKLKREVALKVLPDAFAQDPERMLRFQREAEVLASLNHPNIAHIYGVEERALVMELVEGETLPAGLPLDTALNYARQIAEALEYAHERGVIHRDLKPANVKVTPEGAVKLLDFGLAKAIEDPRSASDDPAKSPTLTMGATRAGVILGTAAYMSPEQATGKIVDRRADIWSFGAVLYEMLSGKRAFEGESASDILASVLKLEPDWNALPAEAPASIRRLIRRCLTKDRKQRLQAIGEARIAIEESLSGADHETQVLVAPASRKRRALPWAVAGIFALASLSLGYVAYRAATKDLPKMLSFSILPPEKMSFGPSIPAVSPDGRRVAFNLDTEGGQFSLWVRDLDSLAARQLAGTEGALMPFWSPDSRFIAFFAGGKLKKIDAAGGPVLTLCDCSQVLGGVGGAWSKDGVILFTPAMGGLFRVSAAGGTPTPVTVRSSKAELFHGAPSFLPDSRHFVYTLVTTDPNALGGYISDLDSKAGRQVLVGNTNVVQTAGYLLFAQGNTLMAEPFDAGKGQTTGDAVLIAEFVEHANNNFAQFSASQNGVLVYRAVSEATNVQLTWFDRSGKPTGTLGTPGNIFEPAISPDGATVAFSRRDPQAGMDVWLHDMAHGGDSRFTFESIGSSSPRWSPESNALAFFAFRDGGYNLYRKAMGATQDQPLDVDDRNKYADDWSRDGRYIIEQVVNNPKTGADIWILPLFGDRKPFPFLHSEFNEVEARLSPNGQWLAYTSDESKRNEVYVASFPNPGGKWRISANGGDRSVWSRDGKELFFIGADQKMMAVEVKDAGRNGARFDYGVPQALFDADISTSREFDIGKDGRFLIPISVGPAAAAPIHVMVNWQARLKK